MALDVAFGPVPNDSQAVPSVSETPPAPIVSEPGLGTSKDVTKPATPVRAPTSPLERTVTINLSLGGLCLYSDALFPMGSQFYCAVTVPGCAKPVEAMGTLVWFQKADQDAHGYKLGIEFDAISPEHLAALQQLFEHPPSAAPSRAKKLLLVDDDLELQLAIKLRLESAGFQVITASDGLEALRKGREEHPHLIILDLMLPHLNGYEVCRLLKFDQKFQRIPIMVFTARSRQQDMEMGRAVGADAYVTKPCNGKELIAKVEELLAKR